MKYNRELKFRIWYKGTSTNVNFNKPRWIQPTDFILLKYYRCFQDVIESDDFIVQQYTGLKDKNGKEIYEGDIVKHRKHNKEVRIGEFSDGVDERTGVFLQDPKIKHINFGTNRLSSFSSCEIIGNVFETPELLKTNE